ncbi:MerR family transcriptional regulator [Virgibacillus chiguensis]|uniref:DNA-binding transcriptional regulator, MerR family n=1 Tax=Virgibacillus chiguensis TaxID=411959 RepID=A0A1M5L5I8_9BACI|nr:MerR family transcriptional regulator [Virgibacillus chiguensis]SHG60220.1 DNA-binding transcriptional regulator, MerR family [Virgibacillus chiguensis]
MAEKYFKTGDIAKFHGVSSDTVRYYDKENLVTPSVVKDNRYRYYSLNDALKFSNVTWLRELGVPLKAIKNWLDYKDLTDVSGFNETYLETLLLERELLDKKIYFLQELNRRLASFQTKPNMWEVVKDNYIFICKGFNFTADDKGFNINESNLYDSQEDVFWNKTSMIVYQNNLRDFHHPKKGEVYCSNIISSIDQDIKKISFPTALRYNFVGNPFSNMRKMQEILKEAKQHATTHQLCLEEYCYSLFYLSQIKEKSPVYYVHIYCPVHYTGE